MKDAFGTELKVGQSIIVSRGRYGHQTKARVVEVRTVERLVLRWSMSKQMGEERTETQTRVRYKYMTSDGREYVRTAFVPGRIAVVG